MKILLLCLTTSAAIIYLFCAWMFKSWTPFTKPLYEVNYLAVSVVLGLIMYLLHLLEWEENKKG